MLILRTFGGLSVETETGVLRGAAAQRSRLAILAVLAAAGEGEVSRERLTALLWPDSDNERGRGSLKQALYAVRRDTQEERLTIGTTALRLNAEVLTSDVQIFQRALREGDLLRAVTAYTGPFLDGIHIRNGAEFDRWVQVERDRYLHAYRDALEQLAHEAEARDDLRGAVGWWRKRAGSEPLSARVASELMKGLAAAGDKEAAVAYADTFAAITRAELEIDPDPSVALLAEALRARPHVKTNALLPPAVGKADAAHTDIAPPPLTEAQGTAVSAKRRPAYAWAGAALFCLLLASAAVAMWLRPATAYAITSTKRVTATPTPSVDASTSPDGRLIAFASGPLGAMRIYVQQVDGTRPIPLTQDTLTDQRSPRWSPDGRQIAFQAGRGVFVVPSLGGEPRRLAGDGTHEAFGASWAPDGKRIAYSDDRGVWTRAVDGGPATLLASGSFQMHSPTWSHDGAHIAYVVGNQWYSHANMGPSAIWIVAASGGAPVRITSAEHLHSAPVFAPDGKSLLYVSDRDGTRDVFQQPLRNGMYPNGSPARITTGGQVFTIDVTNDGGTLVYSTLSFWSSIWSIPIHADSPASWNEAQQVTFESENIEVVNISRDGNWLVFDSNKRGNADVYRMQLSGGKATQLTFDKADDFAGVLSPDNTTLAYYSIRAGTRQLRLVDIDSAMDRGIAPFHSHTWSPQWSPDGRAIAFVGNETGERQIYLMKRAANGGWLSPRQLTHAERGSTVVAWAPRGDVMAWTPDSTLTIVPANGGAPRVLVDGRRTGHVPNYVAWAPDGEHLFYHAADAQGHTSYWEISPSGGMPRMIFRPDNSGRTARRNEFATDGKRLYFTMANDEATIWLANLKR